MKKVLLSIISLLCISIAWANPLPQNLNNSGKLFFIENNGQWPDDVLYFTRIGSMDVWIKKTGLNYHFQKIDSDNLNSKSTHPIIEDYTVLNHRVILDYVDCNVHSLAEGYQKQNVNYNYLLGNDRNKHAVNVGLYNEVVVKNIYEGIDVRYYFDQGTLRYDFIVHPGANPNDIRFKLRGHLREEIKENQIVFTTRFGDIAVKDLYTYQGSKNIASSFVRNGEILQINVGNYDKNKPLIIDPLVFSTFIGGNSDDRGNKVAVDASGNVYVVGVTASADYDTTVGAFQTSYLGSGFDVFVSKFNNTGTSLVYSTLIGGTGNDWGGGIVVDGSGNVYITGYTASANFPVSSGAHQTSNESFSSGYDAFVTKLNATGTDVIYSTYLGGNNNDIASEISVDANGNAYITGNTSSSDFDVTTGAFQTTKGGFNDAFVTKLNASGTALLYSTYLGGDGADIGNGITVDSNGNAFVAGETASTDFPTTSGAYQTSGAGSAFVTKVDATGANLLYSTYLGGTGSDYASSVAVDGSGNAYVTGRTASTDFPTTSGSLQLTYGGGLEDAFVTKLNTAGSDLIYSTYLGGSGNEIGNSIVVDGLGNTYLTGNTSSTNFPVSVDALQSAYDGGVDVFITKLNTSGTSLTYSTFIGGTDFEKGNGIAIDNSGSIYVTGETNSLDFEVTTAAFQTTNAGGWRDVFLTKIGFSTTEIAEENVLDNSIQIFPNPASVQFTIQTDNGGIFELIDMKGNVINVYRFTGNSYTVNEMLSSGIYLIKENTSGKTLKLVIE